jgi:hypothetical protein
MVCQGCLDLARGVKSIHSGQYLLRQSYIDPTKEESILFGPNEVGKICNFLTFIINDELRWARFRSVNKAQYILATQS